MVQVSRDPWVPAASRAAHPTNVDARHVALVTRWVAEQAPSRGKWSEHTCTACAAESYGHLSGNDAVPLSAAFPRRSGGSVEFQLQTSDPCPPGSRQCVLGARWLARFLRARQFVEGERVRRGVRRLGRGVRKQLPLTLGVGRIQRIDCVARRAGRPVCGEEHPIDRDGLPPRRRQFERKRNRGIGGGQCCYRKQQGMCGYPTGNRGKAQRYGEQLRCIWRSAAASVRCKHRCRSRCHSRETCLRSARELPAG